MVRGDLSSFRKCFPVLQALPFFPSSQMAAIPPSTRFSHMSFRGKRSATWRGGVCRGHGEQVHLLPVLSFVDCGPRCLTVEPLVFDPLPPGQLSPSQSGR